MLYIRSLPFQFKQSRLCWQPLLPSPNGLHHVLTPLPPPTHPPPPFSLSLPFPINHQNLKLYVFGGKKKDTSLLSPYRRAQEKVRKWSYAFHFKPPSPPNLPPSLKPSAGLLSPLSMSMVMVLSYLAG